MFILITPYPIASLISSIVEPEGIRDYMVKNIDYLKTQIGNPDGADVPNKKYYDPRKWVRESEVTFNTRLEQAFADLNNVNTL